ncbi:MAG: acyl-CoA dehydrogenase family protein [Myxococcota bacterium]
MIDFEPDEEQQLIRETVHQFAANEVRPRARECDEAREVPRAVLQSAHELGLVANGIATEHGGGGERSAVTGVLIAEELAWGDLSIALAALSPSLSAIPVADFGAAGQQARWLPALTGAAFAPGSLAVVEPGFAADVFQPATSATPADGGFELRGQKCLVPWLAGDGPVWVSALGPDGPALYGMARDAAGLKAATEDNLGIQAFPTAELQLDGVMVAANAVLPVGPDGLAALLHRGRVALAAMAVGVARASFEVARDYAKEREAFGGPIATKQAIAFKLADMAIEIDAARLLTWEAAWRLDQGLPAGRETTLASRQAQRVALEVADGAVQVFGGHGYIRDYLPEMHLRNARGFSCFEALTLV